MKKLLIFFIAGMTLLSCKKNDSLTIDDSVNQSENTPVYTFDVQDVAGKDSIPLNQPVTYQVFIKQQDFYQSGQTYTLTWLPSDQQLDGTLTYNGKEYRQGELIKIPYDSIKDTNVFNVIYKAFSARKGDYELDFTILDRKAVTATKKKIIKVY
jgi:hypothetical protein